MSFWKAFFHPLRLALGAVVFVIIVNPGILFNILTGLWILIAFSWIASAGISMIVPGLVLDND
ncbi:MAG: hypothetical protein HN757_17760 [Calditrichaeota bacterium]|jgi:hypothetical protein|nr:hypothetical protein [Calditrichota bacterium]